MLSNMRIEPFGIDSVVHVTKRGTRGMNIVRDNADHMRFVRSLFFLNDSYSDPYWHEAISDLPMFARPEHWPEREPLVHVLAWTLLSNHFHLLLQEIHEGGISKFMQKLGGSMSKCFNMKYQEKGSIFQSSYHGRVVDANAHLTYLAFYILVKNVLEMYPGGLLAAQGNFDDAWEWASHYPFSSMQGYISGAHSPIIDGAELLADIIGKGNAFKREAKELLDMNIASRGEGFKDIILEPW